MELDEQTRTDLKRWMRKLLSYLAVFGAGGIVAFSYSYTLLHSTKDWKIGYLEERQQAKDRQLDAIEEELAQLQRSAAEQPDSTSLAAVEEELAAARSEVSESKKKLSGAEKKLSGAEKKIRELDKARSHWKAEHTAAENRADQLALELARADQSEASSGRANDPDAANAPSAADDSVDQTGAAPPQSGAQSEEIALSPARLAEPTATPEDDDATAAIALPQSPESTPTFSPAEPG